MRAIVLTVVLACLFTARFLRAHEGHDSPGATPPAPHGGKVQEAEHAHGEEKEHEDGHAHGDGKEHAHEHEHEHEGKKHADEHGDKKHDEHEHEGKKHADKHDGNKHVNEHAHGAGKEEKEEAELFFEAVYKDKELRLYPLALTPKDTSGFTSVSPAKAFSKFALSIEYPRTKRVLIPSFTKTSDAIVAKVDPQGGFRFFARLAAIQDGETKTALIQVETD